MSGERSGVFRTFTEYLFYSNLHVALLAAGLVWANSIWFGKFNPVIISFVFFATLFIYCVDRLLAVSSDEINDPDRTRFVIRNQLYFRSVTIVSFMVLSYILQFLSWKFLIISSVLAGITIVYLLLFNSVLSSIVIKVPLLKPVALSFVWTFVTLVLPAADDLTVESMENFFWPMQIRMAEYFANGVFFDYRDRIGDRMFKRGNIFVRWQDTTVFKVLLIFLIVVLGITIGGLYYGKIPLVFIGDLITIGFYAMMSGLFGSNRGQIRMKYDRYKFLYPAFIDGILFLPVLTAIYLSLPAANQ